MSEPGFVETPPDFITRDDGLKLACRYQPGTPSNSDAPCLVFLPGYMSDMQGGKAQALSQWASQQGYAMLRMDYSGCGESEGDFADGCFTIWRDDVRLALKEYAPEKNIILIGSSMGGWLMLLLALKLQQRVKAIVGIAAAPDFTDWGFNDEQKAEMAANGVVYEENPYGPEPTPTYLKLWQDGEAQKLLSSQIPIDCPVRLLHGQRDADVPWDISMQIAERLRSDDVQIRLVKDGDHRLSRPQDIDLLIETVAGMAHQIQSYSE